MDKASYLYQNLEEDTNFYTFVSKGEQGNIQKVVAFQAMNLLLYNVALLDYDTLKGEFSDEFISNNYDLNRVFIAFVKSFEIF